MLKRFIGPRTAPGRSPAGLTAGPAIVLSSLLAAAPNAAAQSAAAASAPASAPPGVVLRR